ncbi:hypothetical protein HYT84_04395 [Candidatus Micrarchaeota archaeon]|nr:hypothetical protein [Candidatus Micrarchaeota archaeon]
MIESKTILKVVGVLILLVMLYKLYTVAEENDYWLFATEDKLVVVDKTKTNEKIELGKNNTDIEKPLQEENAEEIDYSKYTGNYDQIPAGEEYKEPFDNSLTSEPAFSEEQYFNMDYSWKKKIESLETYAGPADSDGTEFAAKDGIKEVIRINVDFKDKYGVVINSADPALVQVSMWAVDPYALDPMEKSAELGQIYTNKYYEKSAKNLAYSIPLGDSGLFVRYKSMNFKPLKYSGSGADEYTKIKIKVNVLTGPDEGIQKIGVLIRLI